MDTSDDSDTPAVSRADRHLDATIIEAAREVDVTLIDWALSLTPRERLRACTNATRALGRFAHEPPRPR